MRVFVIISVVVAACVCAAMSAVVPQPQLAEELLAVDAGDLHANGGDREARQFGYGGFGGRPYGGYGGGYGGYRGGYGGYRGGYGGGGFGRPGFGGPGFGYGRYPYYG